MERTGALIALASVVAACGGAPLPTPPPVRVADPELLLERYYARVNAEDLAGVLALLDARVVLVEPFSRPERASVHRGREAVGRFFQTAFQTRDDHVVPEFVRVTGARAEAGWSLHGADGAGVSGLSRFGVENGQITRIEIGLRE